MAWRLSYVNADLLVENERDGVSVARQLLSIIEIGGYGNPNGLYQTLGYEVQAFTAMRKALAWLKKNCPEVVVAEFNFDPTFRDRLSNVESLLATLQRQKCSAKVILLLEPQRRPQLDEVLKRYEVDAIVELPMAQGALESALGGLIP